MAMYDKMKSGFGKAAPLTAAQQASGKAMGGVGGPAKANAYASHASQMSGASKMGQQKSGTGMMASAIGQKANSSALASQKGKAVSSMAKSGAGGKAVSRVAKSKPAEKKRSVWEAPANNKKAAVKKQAAKKGMHYTQGESSNKSVASRVKGKRRLASSFSGYGSAND